MELKDWLNSINFNKNNLIEEDPEAISSYPPYIVNRCLSGHLDTVLFANEMNKYSNLDKDMQYSFFLYTLRKRKRFSPWLKKEQQKIIDNLKNRKFKPIEYPLNHPHNDHLKDLTRTDIPYYECKEFYETDEWKTVRDDFLSKQPKPFQCNTCNRTPDPNYKKAPIKRDRPEHEKERLRREFNENRIVVDHKLPLKYFWNLRLDQSNFQLLCGCCNEAKCNKINWEHLKEATIRARTKK